AAVRRGGLGGRRRGADERGGIGRPVDDVDLLTVQLPHDRPDPATHRPDARALRVDPGDGGPDRDLGTVTSLTCDRRDLDRAVGDLRHLKREQLLDQGGMGPRQRDLWTAEALDDVYDHTPDPLAVLVHLAG